MKQNKVCGGYCLIQRHQLNSNGSCFVQRLCKHRVLSLASLIPLLVSPLSIPFCQIPLAITASVFPTTKTPMYLSRSLFLETHFNESLSCTLYSNLFYPDWNLGFLCDLFREIIFHFPEELILVMCFFRWQPT